MHSVYKTITINTSKTELWQALTTPEIVQQYLMGAQVTSDWIVGSTIVYQGEYNGIKFRDEGVIDILDPEKEFKYSYWSANHGTVNSRENFVSISYKIEEDGDLVRLEVNQTNYQSKEIAQGMEHIWDLILSKLKGLLEK